jgi:hypothetical protein
MLGGGFKAANAGIKAKAQLGLGNVPVEVLMLKSVVF